MSIVTRLSLQLAAVFLLASLLLFFTAQSLLFDNLEQVEEQSATDQLAIAYNQLEVEIAEMEAWGQEWHGWDSVYRFANRNHPSFLDNQLSDEVLRYNRLHLTMIFNHKRELVFDRYFPPFNEQPESLPHILRGELLEEFIHSSLLKNGEAITGLSLLEGMPAIFTIHRIQPEGVPITKAGYLLFASRIDDAMMSRVQRPLEFSVQLISKHSSEQTQVKQQLDKLANTTLLEKVIYGLRPGERFSLLVELDRSTFALAGETTSRYLWLVLITLAVMVVVQLLLVRRNWRKPLDDLIRQVNALEADPRTAPQLDRNCGPELRRLGASLQKLSGQLWQQQELSERILACVGEAVLLTDKRGEIRYLSPVAERMLGMFCNEAKGQPVDRLIQLEDARHTLSWLFQRIASGQEQEGQRKRNRALIGGEQATIESSISCIRDQAREVTGMILVLQDISKAERLQRHLQHRVDHDAVTGVLSRARFEQTLEILEEELREGTHAVCYLDLDNFKLINDNCGHAIGDRLLRDAATAIRRCIRESDLLARFGGDEFALVLRNIPENKVQQVLEKITREVEEITVYWDSGSYSVSVSVGVSVINSCDFRFQERVREADAACYAAKNRGTGLIHYYDAASADLQLRCEAPKWAIRINEAIEQDNLVLFHQRIHATEADDDKQRLEILLRMQEEDGTLLMPGQFISAAERFHLMPKVDRWVIRKVFAWLKQRPESWNRLLVSVNLAAETIGSDDLVQFVLRARKEFGIPARCICFEITESGALRNLASSIKVIRRLRKEGFKFALDDFGSGFASYGYLKELPVDIVKLDGNFVRTMDQNEKDYALVKSIHDVCRVMGMQTVAEFVENRQILVCLGEIGVNFAQGFALDKPKALSELNLQREKVLTS